MVYLNALEEEGYNIAHAAISTNEDGKIVEELVEVRYAGKPGQVTRDEVHFIDVAPHQAFSIATSMIPFLNHDDAARALMGSNMQKQATPCIVPEAPLVATGIEHMAGKYSGRVIIAEEDGTITAADARQIVLKNLKGKRKEISSYQLLSNKRFHCLPPAPYCERGR